MLNRCLSYCLPLIFAFAIISPVPEALAQGATYGNKCYYLSGHGHGAGCGAPSAVCTSVHPNAFVEFGYCKTSSTPGAHSDQLIQWPCGSPNIAVWTSGNMMTCESECPDGSIPHPDGWCDIPPPPPPGCDEFSAAPGDPTESKIAFVKPGESGITDFCTPLYSKDPEPCQDVIGYINGHELCNDDKNECEADGGTYGMACQGEDCSEFMTSGICIPGDYADQLPTCDISSVQVVETWLDTDGMTTRGGFACASPVVDPQNNEIPFNEPPEESDIDGDGIPDSNDPDIDGDGIPNGQDTDQDGDGIEDPNDPTPQGEGDPDSEVSGGGSCAQAPACKGDAIQCAILYQTWKGRCDAEKVEKVPGASAIEAAIGQSSDTGSLTDTTDLTNIMSGVYNQTGNIGSCPSPYTLSLLGASQTFDYTPFCNVASGLRPFVILLFSFFAFRIVMRAF